MIASFLIQLETLFGWLLAASWQAAVLALFVLLIQKAFGPRLNPRWRYSLWLLVVLRLVMPILPESALSLFQFAPAPPAALAVSVTEPLFVPAPILPSPALSAEIAEPGHPFSIYSLLALIWLAGAVTLLVLTWIVNHRFGRQVARSPIICDPELLRLFADAKAELRVRRPIRLVENSHVQSPAIMGLFQPTLLLPANVRDKFDAHELRFIFLHELAHLKRGDVIVQALIALLQILHWFNPVLWYAFRRMRLDREPATDALVLSRTGEAEKERYGLMLIKLLEHFNQRHSLPTLVGILEDKDQFKRRFSLIARFTRGAYGWSLLGFILLTTLGAIGLTESEKKGEPAPPSAFLEVTFMKYSEPKRVQWWYTPPQEETGEWINASKEGAVFRDYPLKAGENTVQGKTPALAFAITFNWQPQTPDGPLEFNIHFEKGHFSSKNIIAIGFKMKVDRPTDSVARIVEPWTDNSSCVLFLNVVKHPSLPAKKLSNFGPGAITDVETDEGHAGENSPTSRDTSSPAPTNADMNKAQKGAPKSETSTKTPDTAPAHDAVFYQALERDRTSSADSSVKSSTPAADAQMLRAIQKGDVPALEKVLEHAVDPHTFDPDRFNSSPVYWAVYFDQPEILRLLLEHFADGGRSPAQETPLQLAQKAHPDLIPILQEGMKRNRATLTAQLITQLHSVHIDLPAYSNTPLPQVDNFWLQATSKVGYLERRVAIGALDLPATTRITSPSRSNISLWDALGALAQANGLRFAVDDQTITFYPPADELMVHPPETAAPLPSSNPSPATNAAEIPPSHASDPNGTPRANSSAVNAALADNTSNDLAALKRDLLAAKEDADARRVLADAVKNLPDDQFLAAIAALGRTSPTITALQSDIEIKNAEIQGLLKSGFTGDHPRVQALRGELTAKQEQLKPLAAGARRAMTIDCQMADSRVTALSKEVAEAFQSRTSAALTVPPDKSGAAQELDDLKQKLLQAKEDSDARRVLVDRMKDLGDDAFLATLAGLGRSDPTITALQKEIADKNADIAGLMKSGFTEDHPRAVAQRAELSSLRQDLKRLADGLHSAMTIDNQMAASRVTLLARQVEEQAAKTNLSAPEVSSGLVATPPNSLPAAADAAPPVNAVPPTKTPDAIPASLPPGVIGAVVPKPPLQNPPPPDLIQIELKMVEIPDDIYHAHQAAIDAGVEKGGPEIFRLSAQWKGVTMLSAPSVATKAGLKATVEILREFPYPISFDSAKVGTNSLGQPIRIPPTPREFVTQNVGVSAEITPTIDDGNSLDHGKIILNGNFKITDFDGFIKSNLAGVQMPSFNTHDSLFIEELADRQTKGFWIPGSRFDEQAILSQPPGGPPISSTNIVKQRFLLFLSATLMK